MKEKSFLQSLVDKCPFATCILHVDLDDNDNPCDITFVYLNKACADMSHRNIEDLTNKRYYDIFPSADKKWLQLYYEVAYFDKTIDIDEISSAANMFLHITAIPGNRKGFCLSVLRDIKDREREKESYQKKLKEALSSVERERYYLNLLSFDYTNIYYIDLKSGQFELIKRKNGANGSKLLEKDQVFGDFTKLTKAYVERFVPANEKEFLLHKLSIESMRLDLLIDRQSLFHYSTFPNEYGQKYFEGRIIRVDGNDGSYGALLAFRYIDEIIEKEKAIQNKIQKALDDERISNEVIKALAQLYEGIYRIDLNENSFDEVKCYRNLHEMMGYKGKADVMFNKLCDNFVSPEFYDFMKEFLDLSTLQDRLKNEDNVFAEFLGVNGLWHLACFLVKRRDENNVATNVLYVTRSISDQKKKEQVLALEASRQRQANNAKTAFLSSMAHDIKTPLSAISGFVDIGINEFDNKEKLFNCLKQIKHASNYLNQIVQNTFDIDAIENGIVKVKEESVNLTKLFEEFKEVILPLTLEKNISLKVNVHDLVSEEAIVDSTKLKRIIYNLFINSINYTKKNGTVGLDARQERIDDNNVKLIIKVYDNGIGMSEDFQKEMFDRFSRETDTCFSQTRGMGIGLNIVKEFTNLLGGKISVKSKKDVGTVFKLEFNLKTTKILDKQNDEIKYSDVILRILIAEDNDINYEVLNGLLDIYKGIYFKDIITARVKNGKQCLELYSNNSAFDCILMDIQMPVMDGMEATKLIREFDKNIPIIAVTANSHTIDKQACINIGFNDFVSKPIDKQRLLEVLSELR